MNTTTKSAAGLAWYLAHWRIVVPLFWIALYCINATMNSVTATIEVNRIELGLATWKPVAWEWSSHLVLLALVPFVVAMHRCYPLHFETTRQHLPKHLLASVAYSVLHVVAMVLIRKAAYATMGEHYDFGNWALEFFYEYLKDVRSYFSVLFILWCHTLLVLRSQGEARLLAAPEVGSSDESVERPTRFLVKKLGKEFLLPVHEIERLEAWGNYVNLRVSGKDFPLRSTMNEIEARLDPARFVRVHRSHIVNVDCIASIESLESGDARIELKSAERIPASRRYREQLRRVSN